MLIRTATSLVACFIGTLHVPFGLASDISSELRVPEGFRVEQVSAAPSVVFPMFAAFDDRGRLFVAESSGLNLYAEISALTRKCRVSVLEDRDGDGRFELARVFAEQLVFPMGLAWRDNKLYVADPPDLVTLEDTDGDGTADKRTVILSGFGHRDNGSLHGLIFGPDGLLYMTMGSPDGYRLARRDGTVLAGQSGALLRCQPNGSDVEVIARGFENLVEIAFLPSGEIIGTSNWFQRPAAGLRDALVHLVAGGLYPLSERDVGTPQPVLGEPLPALSLFPAVALSGIARYRGASFPTEMRHSLFTAQHNSRKIGRHVLVRDGSTFHSQDLDFVTTDNPDFHPSDVLEDADGSLLVVDTGGWYVQHCPTGKIRNSRAPGGIYRVRYAQAGRASDPYGDQLVPNWADAGVDDLVRRLGDPRPAVRDRAQRVLSERYESDDPDAASHAIPHVTRVLAEALDRAPSDTVKEQVIWTLAGIRHDSALRPLRRALESGDSMLSGAAARALAMRRDRNAERELSRMLNHPMQPVRLAAAEALAWCGSREVIPSLWDALAEKPDRLLEHALIYAAYRLAERRDVELAIDHRDLRIQKAGLILLDQTSHRAIQHGEVIARVSAADPELRQTALRILRNHPEWSQHTLGLLRGWLKQAELSREERLGLQGLLLAFQSDTDVQELVAAALAHPNGGTPIDCRQLLLETVAQCTLPKVPESWIAALRQVIEQGEPALRAQAVRAAAVLQVPQLDSALDGIAEDNSAGVSTRVEALRAVVARRPRLTPGSFELLIRQLDGSAGPLERMAAAEIVGRAHLSDAQLARLLDALDDALVWPALLPAFGQSQNAEIGSGLLRRLTESVRRGGWRPRETELWKVLEGYPETVHKLAGTLIEALQQDIERQRERLANFETLLEGGDAARGREIFFGKQVACSACHRIGNDGGQVGPDLTRVGTVRSGRDLVESIVLPSSTFAQQYESYLIATADGRVLSGIVAGQTADTLLLRDSSGAETRLRSTEIQELKRHEISIMPEGLEAKLTREEFRHLLAFLQSLK